MLLINFNHFQVKFLQIKKISFLGDARAIIRTLRTTSFWKMLLVLGRKTIASTCKGENFPTKAYRRCLCPRHNFIFLGEFVGWP